MITCRELIDLLPEFLADELPRERRDHVERHLDGCDGCVAYMESYRLTIRLSRRLAPPPLPPRLQDQVEAVLRGQQPGA